MADNTLQNGTDSIATDEVATLNGAGSSGVKVQRVKTGFGDDADYRDVSSAFPLPVNVTASGGNIAPVTQALTAAGAATLAGAGSTSGSAVINVGSAGNASFHLLATAFVGTVIFEQSFDPAGANGTWAPVPCLPEDALSAPMSTLAISTAAAYIRQFTQGMFGPALFRIRVTAYTSGTLTAYLKAGPGWVEAQPALAPSASVIGTVNTQASTLGATGTAAAGTAVTATLAAPGVGLYQYITMVEIQRYAAAALTGAATPIVVTSTNLPGTPAWTFDTAAAIGTSQIQILTFSANPVKASAANTAVTIVCPATTSVIWRVNVTYYNAP